MSIGPLRSSPFTKSLKMTAKNVGAATGPLDKHKEAALVAGGSLESERFLLQWLRTGADYYRRLAHVIAAAARKGAL